MKAYNIGKQAVDWVEDFLGDRKQFVEVNGARSSWADVTSGIPQGSVLVPLLFVIFINDLLGTVSSPTYLFADDTKIFRRIKDEDDHIALQKDLDAMDEWSKTWLLKFHPNKCKFMHMGKDRGPEPNYKLCSHTLQQTTEEKDIGVLIDDELTFEKHINEKINKANQMISLI